MDFTFFTELKGSIIELGLQAFSWVVTALALSFIMDGVTKGKTRFTPMVFGFINKVVKLSLDGLLFLLKVAVPAICKLAVYISKPILKYLFTNLAPKFMKGLVTVSKKSYTYVSNKLKSSS